MNLNGIHMAQISRFNSFFKGKRDRALADREGEKDNFISDRLMEESAIFNYADVKLLLEAYHSQVMASFRDELEKTANLSAVFVSQLLGQAEASGMSLQVEDISVIEDQARVGQMGQMASLPAVSAPPLAPKRAQLSAVEGVGGTDPALLQQLQDLRAENQMMKERNMNLQTEMSTVLKERSVLSSELDQVKTQMALQAGGTSDANAAELARQLSQMRDLKEIIKKKTTENKELKQRMLAAGLAPPDDGQCIELEADDD
eukprot:CAMPEP_0179064690 /NCGR_PEP_ID=MMETSP0796-20121207/28075_1 /TAXON_ID=73915 /ORGANISM="Pyrodinium bahamense, Strain pbaha01" /LENGTH=258 /DNA_ID=CAMNT_0020761639 /DNA_START=83 /DNA_END=859 /DNA_ORIENTATION=+